MSTRWVEGGRRNPRPLQGAKGPSSYERSLDMAEVQSLWASITDQVEQRGLELGVRAEIPPARVTDY